MYLWAEHDQLCMWVNHTIREQCVGYTVLSDQRNRTASCSRSRGRQRYSEQLPKLCIPLVPYPDLPHLDPCITVILACTFPFLSWQSVWCEQRFLLPVVSPVLPGWDFTPGNPCWAVKPTSLLTDLRTMYEFCGEVQVPLEQPTWSH